MKQTSHGYVFNALQETLSRMKCSTKKQMSKIGDVWAWCRVCAHCGPGAGRRCAAPPRGLSYAPFSKINVSPVEERLNSALEIVFSFPVTLHAVSVSWFISQLVNISIRSWSQVFSLKRTSALQQTSKYMDTHIMHIRVYVFILQTGFYKVFMT